MKIFMLAIALIIPSSSSFAQEIQEGLPEHLLYLETKNFSENSVVVDQNIAAKRIWENGQTIKVCFFGGDEVVRRLVAEVGSEWEEYANLIFDFGKLSGKDSYDCQTPSAGFSHIRIGFSERGYWSAVGVDSVKRMNQYQPSMNLEAFDSEFSSSNGYTVQNVTKKASKIRKSTIIHEFGHAIGLLHEHQNKNLDCWSELIKEGEGNVFDYFGGHPNYWNRNKVERNLSNALKYRSDAKGGEPDSASIMMYLLPETVLKGGTANKCFIEQKNTRISNKDKSWVSQFYPPTAQIPIDETSFEGVVTPTVLSDLTGRFDEDEWARFFADLKSNDTSTRRGARATLAELVKARPSGFSDELITKLSIENYRSQLGIAVAVSQGSKDRGLSSVSIQKVESLLEKTKDATLSKYLKRILANAS